MEIFLLDLLKLEKNIYLIYDDIGKITKINPLPVLGFHIYYKCQRNSFGIIIFQEMINK